MSAATGRRRAAVVLSEAEYARLLQAQPKPVPGQSALQWLLTQAPKVQRSRAEIDAELEAGRDGRSPCSMPRRRSI
ncbi:MAG: hypothetical protein ACK5PG_17505 [Lysobacterales bacterium]